MFVCMRQLHDSCDAEDYKNQTSKIISKIDSSATNFLPNKVPNPNHSSSELSWLFLPLPRSVPLSSRSQLSRSQVLQIDDISKTLRNLISANLCTQFTSHSINLPHIPLATQSSIRNRPDLHLLGSSCQDTIRSWSPAIHPRQLHDIELNPRQKIPVSHLSTGCSISISPGKPGCFAVAIVVHNRQFLFCVGGADFVRRGVSLN